MRSGKTQNKLNRIYIEGEFKQTALKFHRVINVNNSTPSHGKTQNKLNRISMETIEFMEIRGRRSTKQALK